MSADPLHPSPLPIRAKGSRWPIIRVLVLGLAQALTLGLFAWLFGGVTINSVWSALLAVAVLSVLNALVWPIIIRLALPLVVWTVGLFTFVLNALFVAATAALVDGFEVNSLWTAFGVSLALAAVNVAVGGLLSIDDDHAWRQIVVRRMVKKREPVQSTSTPGILFIQIDGLGHDVLRDAMADGHAPMLARLVEHGSHTLVPWECDLSSQTGAMQAGILLGDNHNMPAFRWYEKDSGRIMVSNRPRDAADLEERHSTGAGLLVDGGASRANVFSGDAPDAMFTFSTALDNPSRKRFIYAIATPFAMLRILVLTVVDIGRELRAARRARRDEVEPRMHRGGVYPLLRAATTVVLAEITYSMLIGDIERGVPSAYVDLVGYDEVAHHSGIAAPESLDTLARTDDQLERLLSTLEGAPRPYHVVILSDHGQTQGATYEQRYGETLEDTVRRLADGAHVAAPVLAEEGWNNVNGLLSDAAADDSRLGRTVARTTRSRTTDNEVVLGPATETAVDEEQDVVVLASGNLGLLSFPAIEGRASRQRIDAAHPGLIDGLRNHEGIGFILVRDEVDGDVVIGPAGVHNVSTRQVSGEDPLEPFGTNAADHLRRTSSFPDCPDLLVNSFYDPESDEGAAFEELIGFHGGVGGKQGAPFVLAPTALPPADTPLVGALSIHELFKGWLAAVQGPT
ncbi:MAG: phage holin family protein [Acidimicrobiales bacterium]